MNRRPEYLMIAAIASVNDSASEASSVEDVYKQATGRSIEDDWEQFLYEVDCLIDVVKERHADDYDMEKLRVSAWAGAFFNGAHFIRGTGVGDCTPQERITSVCEDINSVFDVARQRVLRLPPPDPATSEVQNELARLVSLYADGYTVGAIYERVTNGGSSADEDEE